MLECGVVKSIEIGIKCHDYNGKSIVFNLDLNIRECLGILLIYIQDFSTWSFTVLGQTATITGWLQ